MRPSAAETLKAAIRRSLPLTLALVILGGVAVYTMGQLEGPRYEASASVVHHANDLGAILTGTQPSYVDPYRAIETGLALARSPELYERAAAEIEGTSGAALRGSTQVDGGQDSDVIVFSSSAATPEAAVEAVNTVSAEYIRWRGEISGEAIRRAVVQLEGELEEAPGPEASDTELENRSELRDQLTRLRTLETLNSGGAALIEQASEANRVSPRPIRDALFGGSLGLIVALLLAGAREAFNTRVRSEADVEEALGRPVLASIQTLPKRAKLVTVGRHESRYGDAYALLAANLMQIRGTAEQTVLAVTSAIAGEGKTTTAANLAVAMAQRGQRVVLVDFDLRKPSVSDVFRIPSESPGVVQLVEGHANVKSALWSVSLNGSGPVGRAVRVSAKGHAGGRTDGVGSDAGTLRVVGAGGEERGARIARSPRVGALLDQLGSDADIVVLDTPPALATVDMAELSRNVDMVVAVVRQGKVTRRSLNALSRQADGWQTEMVGAVLTDAPPEEDDYSYR